MRPFHALIAFACSAASCIANAQAPCAPKSDILVRSDATLAPVRPADCSIVTQSPPEFTWPPQSGRNTYTLTLVHPDGKSETRSTPRNWALWDSALPPGRYSWRVKVSGANDYASEPRTFTIAPGAVPFVVPSPAALLERAREAPRPRTWSRDPSRPLAALKAERARGFRALEEEVQNKMPAPVQPEPTSGSDGSNYEDTVAEQKRTLASAFAWAATRRKAYGDDAARRLMAQARWSATGPIAYARNDMAHRTVAWTLALGYDWMHGFLDESQRATLREAIRVRTRTMYEDVVGRLAGYPYDSHGNVTLGVVAAIGVLMAGDLPEADEWVKEAVPLAVVWTSPWGWQDGGFANGTAQLFWDTGSNLPVWYILRNAAGLDLSKKEWVRNHARFMAYMAPPGAPAGNFGDGQELQLAEVQSRVSKALARFAPSPLARWYARALGEHEDASRIELMISPRVELGPAPLPAEMPGGAVFPSVGWVAMHSDLADPQRTSVYFKSSPYGSYNHSHGDQNSFAIDHRGVRLAMASGYYDGYHTPHWKDWYKQTRAANAITFDGGQGQGFNGKQFAGEIARFETRGGYDFAVGRADKAYGGALTRAERTIVYIRPGLVLVHDSLASATPRTWEWNIHSANRMAQVSDRAVRIRSGREQMCVEMVSGPDVAFSQTDQFTAPPQGRNMPNQWHGRFATRAPSPGVEFLFLLRVGADCKPGVAEGHPSATAVRAARGWAAVVDGMTVTASGEDVSVEGLPASVGDAPPRGRIRRQP